MRTFLLFISLLALQTVLFGQHKLFIEFGQSADKVHEFLSSRDYVDSVNIDEEMASLRAVLDPSKHVEYGFFSGRHYSTTITRNYADRKTAKEVEKNCLNYMNSVKTADITYNSIEKLGCYTSVADNQVVKLFIIKHPDSITLTLVAFTRDFGPMLQSSRFYYEVDLMQKIYAAN